MRSRQVWWLLLIGLWFPNARFRTALAQESLTRDQILERWIATRLLLSKERAEWQVGKTVLQERIDLLERECDTVRRKREAAEEEIARTEEQYRELARHRDELKEAVGRVQPLLADLEQHVRALLARLPAPLEQRIRPLSRRIPENAATTKLSVGERFQNVIGILNEINKAAREVAVTSEIRDLPGGERIEATVMYLGLAQAYFCNEKGGIAGVGIPQADGWQWTLVHGRVADIAHAVAVYKNEKPAQYVPLPFRFVNQAEEGKP